MDITLQIVTMTGINIIIVLGLNLITSVTGQFSLGHAAFMSIGAYSSAIATMQLALPFYLSITIATIFSGIMGTLFMVSALRLRGLYLTIATLIFSEIVRIILLNISITGGELGINTIPHKTTVTIVITLMLASIIFMMLFERSSFGLILKSIHKNEKATERLSINVAKYKILAFAIGSAFAGLGGALYAHQITAISPNDFGFIKSLGFASMLILGGMGSIIGVLAGAITLTVIPDLLQLSSEYRLIIYSIVFIGMMIFRSQGIFGKIRVKI